MRCGFKELEDGKPADIYVINTCTVTRNADSDSFYFIRRAKRENPQAKVIVTGCLTELDSQRILKERKNAFIVKNQDKNQILNLIGEQTNRRTDEQTGITYFKGHTRAFLKIQDGCNNFCSYCKVPLVRGKSRSKPLKEVVSEAKQLVENGFKEIVLCGICLGSYGKDFSHRLSLTDAIGAIEKIKGLLRIRLSSIEAGDISGSLIEKMAGSQKLCPHLHIPFQSGDDEILNRMNRKASRDGYLKLVKKIRKRIPRIAITTDILVGFPGESEVNFKNTRDLIQKIIPLKAHIFPYSKREGTSAADSFKDEVAPAVIKKRILRLKKIAESCALAYQKRFLNNKMEVLIEAQDKEGRGLWEGHTPNYLNVRVNSKENLKNRITCVKLKKIGEGYILGRQG